MKYSIIDCSCLFFIYFDILIKNTTRREPDGISTRNLILPLNINLTYKKKTVSPIKKKEKKTI